MLNFILLVTVFLIGFITGGLLNPIIVFAPKKNYRNVSDLYCPYCGRKYKFYEHISIFSYIFLNGCCASCNQKINYTNQYVILINIIFYFFSYLVYGFSPFAIILDISLSLFLALAVIQVKYNCIPRKLLVPCFILSLLTFVPQIGGEIMYYSKLIAAAVAIVFCFILAFSIKSKKEEGLALITVAIILGLQNFVYALFLSFIFVILFLIIYSKKGERTFSRVYIIPFLTAGYFISALTGVLFL